MAGGGQVVVLMNTNDQTSAARPCFVSLETPLGLICQKDPLVIKQPISLAFYWPDISPQSRYLLQYHQEQWQKRKTGSSLVEKNPVIRHVFYLYLHSCIHTNRCVHCVYTCVWNKTSTKSIYKNRCNSTQVLQCMAIEMHFFHYNLSGVN